MPETVHAPVEAYGAWNPGIKSDLPRSLLPLVTVYRPENVSTPWHEAQELKHFCGLESHELVAFRPERLVVHEVLIRVTADVAIYDGRQYEDLGINFRRIAGIILDNHVMANFDTLRAAFDASLERAAIFIRGELKSTLFPTAQLEPAPAQDSFMSYIFGRREADVVVAPAVQSSAELDVNEILTRWEERQSRCDDDMEVACLAALRRVVGGIARKHGRVVGDIDLVARIARNLVSNDYGSRCLGQELAAIVDRAIDSEGFRRLPPQPKPVVMNTKGASASGKSTMRPWQHELADRIGVDWDSFALISPDVWRKFLLDYGSLGADFKYASMLCGHEVDIVDRKLDVYMAEKATAERVSHLLVDRFRFDSFTPGADEPVRLLTRFGDLIYMFFMVTPPAATVERAWRRGKIVGRYKAVDDLLAHNVEAYSGMPELFFTWALRTDRRVHYEFLDNDVPLGSRPKTIAYGWNGEMNVLDVSGLINIDRFRKVNVRASSPDEVFNGQDLSPEANVAFLKRCVKLLPVVNFADQVSGRVYARIEEGRCVSRDASALAVALQDSDTRAGLAAIGLSDAGPGHNAAEGPEKLDHDGAHTIGVWGARALNPVAGNFAR